MSTYLVLWVAGFTFVLVLGVVAQIIVVQIIDSAANERARAFEHQWLPILYHSMERRPEDLPAIDEQDEVNFLLLWNRLQESVGGDAKRALVSLAEQVGADRMGRALLASPNLGHQLLAISVLGQMRDRTVLAMLLDLTDDRDAFLSLTAARAAAHIDLDLALERVIPLIVRREDWAPGAIMRMLQEAGPRKVAGPLLTAVQSAPSTDVHRLVRYLSVGHPEDVLPVVHQILTESDDVETITACLRAYRNLGDVQTARQYLTHARWEVRVQAVNVIAQLGASVDEPELVRMLADSSWWVRYRAAQALCALPQADFERLRLMSRSLEDRYARDIMSHVLSERRAA